jgi:hypothetical protein
VPNRVSEALGGRADTAAAEQQKKQQGEQEERHKR